MHYTAFRLVNEGYSLKSFDLLMSLYHPMKSFMPILKDYLQLLLHQLNYLNLQELNLTLIPADLLTQVLLLLVRITKNLTIPVAFHDTLIVLLLANRFTRSVLDIVMAL
jgi:uncharacterized ubiquitin-like protein YukD